MKNLKFGLLAVALIVGIGSAVALQTPASSPCLGSSDILIKRNNTELFIAPGQLAADPNPLNYEVYVGEPGCDATSFTCTYYVENGVVKQCQEGTFNR